MSATTAPPPGVLVLPGAVVISGDALRIVASLVVAAQATRRRNGLPVSRPLAAMARTLEQAMTADGRTAVRDEPDDQSGVVAIPQRVVTTKEASELLEKSERQLRRLAPLLGGRKLGGVWYLDLDALEDHLEGVHA